MTLYQLKSFVTVAKHKSFTLAAETLKVRQPSATLIIQSLERELDVKLFERVGNKVHLTNAGQELLRAAEPIVTRAEGIKERMDEIKGGKKGKLSVGSSGLASVTFLLPAVHVFNKQNPGIEIILHIQRSETLEKQLLRGDIDLAVPSRAPHSSHLVSEPYSDEEVVAVATPDHPLAKKRSVSLALLAKEPLIVSKRGNPIREMLEQKFNEKGISLVPALEVEVHRGGRDAIKRAVANRLGIGFVTRPYVVSDSDAKRLKILKIPELQLKRTIYIVVHKDHKDSPLVQAFLELLKTTKSKASALAL